jgi:hypothetical protein
MLVALTSQGRRARRDLPPGLLVPGATSPNIQSVSEVARLASEMIDELGVRGAAISVLLPDLAVVSAVLPPERSLTMRDIASELAPRLGFPLSEARYDFWRGGKGEVLAAAVREVVVRQYEQVVEATECRVGWVDSASLARVPGWADATSSDPGVTVVEALLYADHYVLALFREGGLVDVRTRLRSEGDVDVVACEIRRLPAIYGFDALGPVALSGEGASACVRLLSEASVKARLSSEEEGEEKQLEASLSALLHRS